MNRASWEVSPRTSCSASRPSREITRRTSSGTGSSKCLRSSASSEVNRSSRALPSSLMAACPGSFMASNSEGAQAGSARETSSVNSSGNGSGSSAASPGASSRARRASAARSARPSRQRSPVSSPATSAFAKGSASTFRVATTGAISGSRSRPPIPTISTGTSCSRRRSHTEVRTSLRRVRTAMSRHAVPSACRAVTSVASQSSSSARVSKHRTRTSPSGAPSPGLSSTPPPLLRVSGSARALPTSRIRLPLRRLMVSVNSFAGSPVAPGKWVGNPRMFEAAAPRHP